MWLEDNYNCDVTKDSVAYGAISTEHSVMCSNFAVDGDEITHIKRLLIDIYFNHNFSMVSDSYDYWRLVTELLPQCKDEILAHNGTLSIRGDSGNPVEVLAGKDIYYINPDEEDKAYLFTDEKYTNEWLTEYCFDMELETDAEFYFSMLDKYYHVKVYCDWSNERGAWTDRKYYYIDDYRFKWEEIPASAELLGTVWALDQIVGHTVNSKGYKVLDPHLKAIYGDSIIPDYADEVYRRLAEQGYAANNVVMGVGSMSMMALVGQDEETGKLVFAGEHNGTNCGPYTRDTFGIAVKATYAEDENGNPINIFKQPKAISWKKSQKGCCIVAPDGMSYTDGHTWDDIVTTKNNLLEQVFYNGRLAWETNLSQVRRNMYPQETFKI
jgi:nicotinamide phosphoribosyltransferase